VAVYAFATCEGALSRIVVLDKEQVQRHIALSHSDAASQWWESWWLKAAVHELAKWVPWSAERLT